MTLKNYLFVFLLLSLFSCGNNSDRTPVPILNLTKNPEIKQKIEFLEEGMLSFMDSGDTDYNRKHVDDCINLIENFLGDMSIAESKKNGMKTVKKLVQDLNKLNRDGGNQLIETSQRELIADIINLSGHLKGFNTRHQDITSRWRDW